MRQYILRRLVLLVPVVIGASLVIFLLLRILPGDPTFLIIGSEGGGQRGLEEQITFMRQQLGLDKPLPIQYLTWIVGLVRLDAGTSIIQRRPVFDLIGEALPVTLELTLLSAFVAFVVAVPAGVASAVRQDTALDYVLRVASIVGLAFPTFWTGTLLVILLSGYLQWMPPLGLVEFFEDPRGNLQQFMWPALTLGFYFASVLSRMTRSCMLEVMRQDYIRTAFSKGLRERLVIVRHGLKNAMLPVVTIAGWQFGVLLGGSVIQETIFSLPGMGRLLVVGIFNRDYPVVQTIIVLLAFIFLVVNLLVDLTYAWLDPRIHYAS
ncbi:MAG: ABC transporter permease [Chloroflexi bacterium]|nr:ABC transporter permease [Chloroflexota bacterium]